MAHPHQNLFHGKSTPVVQSPSLLARMWWIRVANPAQFTKLTVPPQRDENDARSCATFTITFADIISVQKTYSKTRQQGVCQFFQTSAFVRVGGCIACSHFCGDNCPARSHACVVTQTDMSLNYMW